MPRKNFAHAIASMTLGFWTAHAPAAAIQDFVMYGRDRVFVGVGSQITGLVGSGTALFGDVGFNGTAGVIGDVRSGNSVSLANGSFVTGTVTNPGTLSLGAGATVGAHVVGIPDLPSLPAAAVFGHGASNQSVGNGATMNLSPGSWADVSLGGAATLNLSAGDYFLKSLSSGNGLKLNISLAGGTTRIFVTEDVNLGGVDVFLTGGTAADVYVEAHKAGNNAFRAGGGTDWQGIVFTPNGQIHLGSGGGAGSFIGQLWAGTDVDIEHGVIGTPEPSALVLIAAGGLALIRRGPRSS